ncbi:hypothetical protein Godav_001982 [Gossypium davidsonii]|uniref:ADF-H domain-containing protein n=9 Tax=Gossypium TaxID=3633 RepID=A0A7J8T4P6_GOSDV|nr:hypothetical protein [Gossypium davidsonii]MBA0669168.1 hypothetical protein [Gossypium klotzschianum]
MLHLDLLNVRSLCDFKFMVSKPWKVGGDWMVRMIRFLGSLRRLVSRSQECDNVYEANAASGMAVHDDCKLKFLELKAKRTYRFIVFKIEEKQKQVVVEKLGEPSQSYDDFTASLPADECRYAVYDFDFVTAENCQKSRIFFIAWSPDTSRVRSKMIYASSKDRFKRELDGIQVELQATDPTEMGLDVIRSRAN